MIHEEEDRQFDDRCMYYLINGSVEISIQRCRTKLATLKVLNVNKILLTYRKAIYFGNRIFF